MRDISCSDRHGERVVFLVGAGRSGTTLLYKLLCLHSRLAYVTNYDHRLPWLFPGLVSRLLSDQTGAKLKAWFNQGGNAYLANRPWAKKLFPMPVEGEFVYESCGMPRTPAKGSQPDEYTRNCLRRRFDCIRRAMKADLLLSNGRPTTDESLSCNRFFQRPGIYT